MQSVQTSSLVVPSPWIQICTGNKCHLRSIPVLLFLGESVLADDFKISVTTSPASCHWALHLSFNLPFRHLYLDVLGVPSLPGCPGCLTFKGIPCFSPWQHTLLLAPLCLIHPTIFNEYRSQLTVFKQNKSSVIWALCSISSFVLFCFLSELVRYTLVSYHSVSTAPRLSSQNLKDHLIGRSANFFYKGPFNKYLRLRSHTFSATNSQLCSYNIKTTLGNR